VADRQLVSAELHLFDQRQSDLVLFAHISANTPRPVVPEPAGRATMLSGFAAVGFYLRRRSAAMTVWSPSFG
jgi:hypothetical protein